MTRRHADPVEVRGAGGEPTHFLWRDRVYAVREVLAHWREGGAWWEAPATGGRLDLTEREVWRVEASRGRDFAAGVYELSVDRSANRWTLSRAAD